MFDIWLYSDETQTNEIRLSDPSGPAVTVASGAGSSLGVGAVAGQGLTIASGTGTGVSLGSSAVAATGRSTASGAGISSGASTSAGTSSAASAPQGAGAAAGASAIIAAGIGLKTISAAGSSVGASIVTGNANLRHRAGYGFHIPQGGHQLRRPPNTQDICPVRNGY